MEMGANKLVLGMPQNEQLTLSKILVERMVRCASFPSKPDHQGKELKVIRMLDVLFLCHELACLDSKTSCTSPERQQYEVCSGCL